MDRSVLEQYELAHIWVCDKKTGAWTMTERIQTAVPPEILFIERCTQFLAEGGRMGIVLPDSLLGAPGLGYIREWLIRSHRIIASIDLPADTFRPSNGIQTSVLLLQKKTQGELEAEKNGAADYNIFMAVVERIGHDKRGAPIFKRDSEGNELLVPERGGERRVRVIDDQTVEVPAVFAEWKKREGIAW